MILKINKKIYRGGWGRPCQEPQGVDDSTSTAPTASTKFCNGGAGGAFVIKSSPEARTFSGSMTCTVRIQSLPLTRFARPYKTFSHPAISTLSSKSFLHLLDPKQRNNPEIAISIYAKQIRIRKLLHKIQ